MNNKTKGIVFIILIVVILSFSILIAYNFYTGSPNKGTNFDQCTEDCDEDKNGNTTSSTSTSTTTTITTTEDDNDVSYNTTRRTTRRNTTTVRTTTMQTTTTTQAPEVLLLDSGDITKEGTNGSVTYYFYDNGNLVIDGTGDAVMRDFNVIGENILEWDSLILNINQKMFWDSVKVKEPSFDLNELLATEEGQGIYMGMFQMFISLRLGNTDNMIEYLMDQGASEEEAISLVYGGLSAIFTGDIPTVFNKADTLGFVLVDNLIINNNVKVISNVAFAFNGIDTITIPSSVTTIGAGAFANSAETTTVIFDDIDNSKLTSIGGAAFNENSLTSITIPSSVITIGDSAFAKNNIKSVTILYKDGYPETRFNSRWTAIGFPPEFMPD